MDFYSLFQYILKQLKLVIHCLSILAKLLKDCPLFQQQDHSLSKYNLPFHNAVLKIFFQVLSFPFQVTQIPCTSRLLAPNGCLQYYYVSALPLISEFVFFETLLTGIIWGNIPNLQLWQWYSFGRPKPGHMLSVKN